MGTLVVVIGLVCNPVRAQLLPGRVSDDPIMGQEVPTQQIGGAGWWRYVSIGALRCNSSSDAIVGVFTRKGTQIGRAHV